MKFIGLFIQDADDLIVETNIIFVKPQTLKVCQLKEILKVHVIQLAFMNELSQLPNPRPKRGFVFS